MSRRWPERFWEKVDQSGGPDACWPWTGSRHWKGYGQTWDHGRGRKAHRVAWEMANGRPAPEGFLVCHTCDNPPCCNPRHLFEGSRLDNERDKTAKGRRNTRKAA